MHDDFKSQFLKYFFLSFLYKGKILMLLSLACWIGFTVPIGHIHPPVVSCKFYNDTTDKIYLQEPKTYDESKRKKRSLAVLTPGNVLHKI